MERPMDFGLELEKNPAAMKKFRSLTDYEKQSVVNWANSCTSRGEMRWLISNLATDGGE